MVLIQKELRDECHDIVDRPQALGKVLLLVQLGHLLELPASLL